MFEVLQEVSAELRCNKREIPHFTASYVKCVLLKNINLKLIIFFFFITLRTIICKLSPLITRLLTIFHYIILHQSTLDSYGLHSVFSLFWRRD